MPKSKFTEAPPQCQLHSIGCQGFCESPREIEAELCQQCLEVRDARFARALGSPWLFGYTNYRGEYSQRRATPVRFEFESTEHHPEKQWIMHAVDHDKGAMRAFALADMKFPSGKDKRVEELEQMIADLVAEGAGKVKEELDLLRLQAGGMQQEIIELREKLVIARSTAIEIKHSMAAQGGSNWRLDEIIERCKLD